MGAELEAYRLTVAALKQALKRDHPDFPAVDDAIAKGAMQRYR
jgi:hypothetical protein